jgi:Domain of unknown function (DUF4332)
MVECTRTDRATEGELTLRLRKLGIRDADQLLKACATGLDRCGLSGVLGVDVEQITRLVHRADLGRIPGLDDATIDLLSRAGIRTVRALASCNPGWLHGTLTGLNDNSANSTSTHDCTPRALDLETVRLWVAEARRLPRRVWD